MQKRLGPLDRVMAMTMPAAGVGVGGWQPPADILETEDSLFVYLDVSGVLPDNLSVVVEPERLTVTGERIFPKHELCSIHQLEIDYGPFRRIIALPAEIDVNAASSALKNGVLIVTLPRLRTPGRVVVRVSAE